MKKYISEFCTRGLMVCGGGPVIVAIVFAILGATGVVQTFTVTEVCKGILTVTLLAFIAGGITMIYQVEELPLFTAILIHGVVLYLDYILIYLFNGWLKSQIVPILIFTGIFIAGYAVIWCIIYAVTKNTTDNLNKKLV